MKFIALFLLCMFSEAAIAQTSECPSIPKASARLACYDKISPPIAPGKSATAKTPASAQEKYVDLKCANRCCNEEHLSWLLNNGQVLNLAGGDFARL